MFTQSFHCLLNLDRCLWMRSSNTTYKPTSFDKDEILANHRSFMTSSNIPSGKESEDLPYLYWIPKLHKTPYKDTGRYIAGSSTCLFTWHVKILSAVKEGQQKYCETVYSRSGINHMWITWNQDLSLRYPPSNLYISRILLRRRCRIKVFSAVTFRKKIRLWCCVFYKNPLKRRHTWLRYMYRGLKKS